LEHFDKISWQARLAVLDWNGKSDFMAFIGLHTHVLELRLVCVLFEHMIVWQQRWYYRYVMSVIT
jgi:hypothetical protein